MYLYVGARQFDDERRAGARLRVDVQAAPHPLNQLPGDVEAQAGASGRAGQLGARAVELLEDPLLLGERDAGPGVGDQDADGAVGRLDANADSSVAAVLDGVVEKIDQDLLDPVARARRRADLRRDVDVDVGARRE